MIPCISWMSQNSLKFLSECFKMRKIRNAISRSWDVSNNFNYTCCKQTYQKLRTLFLEQVCQQGHWVPPLSSAEDWWGSPRLTWPPWWPPPGRRWRRSRRTSVQDWPGSTSGLNLIWLTVVSQGSRQCLPSFLIHLSRSFFCQDYSGWQRFLLVLVQCIWKYRMSCASSLQTI